MVLSDTFASLVELSEQTEISIEEIRLETVFLAAWTTFEVARLNIFEKVTEQELELKRKWARVAPPNDNTDELLFGCLRAVESRELAEKLIRTRLPDEIFVIKGQFNRYNSLEYTRWREKNGLELLGPEYDAKQDFEADAKTDVLDEECIARQFLARKMLAVGAMAKKTEKKTNSGAKRKEAWIRNETRIVKAAKKLLTDPPPILRDTLPPINNLEAVSVAKALEQFPKKFGLPEDKYGFSYDTILKHVRAAIRNGHLVV